MITKNQILDQTKAMDVLNVIVNGQKYLLLMFAYSPYKYTEGELFIDAYYPASNRAYNICRSFCDTLCKMGFNSYISNDFNYKTAALTSNEYSFCKNQQVSRINYGSYFVMIGIRTDIPTDIDCHSVNQNQIPVYSPACSECNVCINKCPSFALSDNKFFTKRCIRDMMDNPITKTNFSVFNGLVLGCPVCRQYCKLNANKKPVPIPDDLKLLLNLKKILLFDSDTKNAFAKIIGTNYSRSKQLTPPLIAYAVNNNLKELYPIIYELQNSQSPNVAITAKNAIGIINKNNKPQ